MKLEQDFGEAKGHALWVRYSDRFDKDLRLALATKARSLKTSDVDRNLKTAYIYGDGGVGKSQLARAMARLLSNDDGNYYAAAAPDKGKTFDFSGGYKGENVTLSVYSRNPLDNLRSSQSSVNPENLNSGTFFLTESSIFAIVPTIFLVFLVLLSFFGL